MDKAVGPESENEYGEEPGNLRPSTPTLFGRIGGLGEAVVELLVDRDLRRYAGFRTLE